MTPESGWVTAPPDWHGIPCRIGRVQVWLPVQGALALRPFSLLALLPTRDSLVALPYVYLGTQFLVEHWVELVIDCLAGVPSATSGRLLIP